MSFIENIIIVVFILSIVIILPSYVETLSMSATMGKFKAMKKMIGKTMKEKVNKEDKDEKEGE